MIQDVFDDAEDPLPVVDKANKRESVYQVSDSTKATTTTINRYETNDTLLTKIIKNDVLEQKNNEKSEFFTIIPNTFSVSMEPITEKSVIVYGQHYQKDGLEKPQRVKNNTDVKIFWTSFGEAVENIPFLPIEINVPDMISTMANFLATYIPFINRFTNPNRPRLPFNPGKDNQTNPHEVKNYDSYEFDEGFINSSIRREYRIKPKENSAKKRRKSHKRKSNKKRNSEKSEGKKIFPIPNMRKTTMAPPEETKLWHTLGSDQKELFKLKNMPIIRKRIRIADREIFNFKNSDISNSPIMILNVPQRPITHYKIIHHELQDVESTTEKNQANSQVQFSSGKSSSKSRRRMKNDNKGKKSTELSEAH